MAGGVLTALSPFIVTNQTVCDFSFLNTEQIGDTIGGPTAPIIGLMNTYLLIKTLQTQNEQINEQRITANVERLRNSITEAIYLLTLEIGPEKTFTNALGGGFTGKSHGDDAIKTFAMFVRTYGLDKVPRIGNRKKFLQLLEAITSEILGLCRLLQGSTDPLHKMYLL